MVCPKCGALILNEGNPTCYNYVRIEGEQKRYGKRRPKKVHHSPTRIKAQEPAAPETSGKPAKKRPRRRVWKTADSEKVVQPAKKRPTPTISVPPLQLPQQRMAFNDYLAALYERPTYLSQILRDGGLTREEVDRLRSDYLLVFMDKLIAATFSFWRKHLGRKEYEVLKAEYGLGAGRPSPEQQLMEQLGFTKEQIDKYRKLGLKWLGFELNLQAWERLVVDTGREILKQVAS